MIKLLKSVYCEYISGIISVSHDHKESLHIEIEELLSAYLSAEKSKSAAAEIISRCSRVIFEEENIQSCDVDEMKSVEEQMRSLLQASCTHVVEPKKICHSDRDACTLSVLRSAGVSRYLGDSEEEEEEKLKVAMADSEFLTKHRLNLAIGIPGSGLNGFVEDDGDSESGTDLEDIESICGYGQKDGIKPGTVEDALSVLHPSLVTAVPTRGSNMSFTSQSFLPTKDFTSPASLSTSKPHVKNAIDDSDKKKLPPPSKHIAKIGAQAEARQKQNPNSRAMLSVLDPDPKDSKNVRCRREEMEAFLFESLDPNTKSVDKEKVNRKKITLR
ncbi:unnamed protein product [Heterobilharzia americana]|nr:unnamed protein product [Heterobilharzia americana]